MWALCCMGRPTAYAAASKKTERRATAGLADIACAGRPVFDRAPSATLHRRSRCRYLTVCKPIFNHAMRLDSLGNRAESVAPADHFDPYSESDDSRFLDGRLIDVCGSPSHLHESNRSSSLVHTPGGKDSRIFAPTGANAW
jgi:hypothetical protein